MQDIEHNREHASLQFEKLTGSIAVEVGKIVFSVRSLENDFLLMSHVVSRMNNDLCKHEQDSTAQRLRRELMSLSTSLDILKKVIEMNLSTLIDASSSSADQVLKKVSDVSVDFNCTARTAFEESLNHCVALLDQLNEDLFNAEITLIYTT